MTLLRSPDHGDTAPRSAEQRKYAREWARRKRAEKLAAINASASVCQKKRGRHAICGGVLESMSDGSGNVSIACPLCARRAKGICRECGLPVAGKVGYALRCAYHTQREKDRALKGYRARNGDALRKRARDYYRLDRERRERKNARKKLWRQAHPEKVKQYKRREALSQNPNRAEYHRKRRERERTALATRERNRYHGVMPLRTCLTRGCQIVVTGRKKKCTRCKEHDLRLAKTLYAAARRIA